MSLEEDKDLGKIMLLRRDVVAVQTNDVFSSSAPANAVSDWTLPESFLPFAALEERLVLPGGDDDDAGGAGGGEAEPPSRGSYAFYVFVSTTHEYDHKLNAVNGALYFLDGDSQETAKDFATRARMRNPPRKRKRGNADARRGDEDEEEEDSEDSEDEKAMYLDPDRGSPWRKVGFLKGTMIYRPSALFQEMSDTVTQELYDTCRAVCDDRGILRYDDVDGLERFADKAASVGFILHLEILKIDEVGESLQAEVAAPASCGSS